MFQRYALFYTPPPGQFEDAGRAWLGWCSREAREIPQPRIIGLDVPKLTQNARKYGLHATLVAPFALAYQTREEDLLDAVDGLSQTLTPASMGSLEVSAKFGFLSLRPQGEAEQVAGLAAQAVRALFLLRADPSEAELARRRRARLTARQEANLMRWGYPYVMEDFNFHITLTGRTPRDKVEDVRAAISEYFATVAWPDGTLDAITLMGERCDGRFVQIRRAPITG